MSVVHIWNSHRFIQIHTSSDYIHIWLPLVHTEAAIHLILVYGSQRIRSLYGHGEGTAGTRKTLTHRVRKLQKANNCKRVKGV
jgi:hypothetical protein